MPMPSTSPYYDGMQIPCLDAPRIQDVYLDHEELGEHLQDYGRLPTLHIWRLQASLSCQEKSVIV